MLLIGQRLFFLLRQVRPDPEAYSTRGMAMNENLHGIQINFSEVMRGFVSAQQTIFADGYAEGAAAGHTLALHVAVDITDLADFLDKPEHAGSLSGHIDCPMLGGICPVQSGTFRLMPDTADLDRKVMYYQVYCTTPQGNEFTFVGNKQVQHLKPFDLWHDTTTLYVNVFRGHVDPAEPAHGSLWVTGIISLGMGDFLQVLHGLRATDAHGHQSIEGLLHFGQFFAGKLWSVYGPHMPIPLNRPKHPYPRFTTEGVTGAQVSIHPFSTADGLGLQLTRFHCGDDEAPGKDSILIVHGLTNSSDMFMMPEHLNLVQYLLNEGFSDIWLLDYRGSNRFPYNLEHAGYNFDDIVLFDHPAAMAELRKHIGPRCRLHVIAHCVGSMTMAMALFAGTIKGISSMILNSVALTPYVPRWSKVKLALGPWAADHIMRVPYFDPAWRRQSMWSVGKLLACAADLVHQECDSPECHMLSFMWGSGRPAVFNHANLAPETHARLGDLFGGVDVNYYRHVYRMLKRGNTAVKFEPANPLYATLPDNYLTHAEKIETPIFFVQGQDNHVFADSNIRCHARLGQVAPQRHRLQVFPGYGHQDVFMGKNVAVDIFPHFISFLREHCHD